jgi:hypothetical protein
MTPEDWRESARADAEKRGLPDLQAMLGALAATAAVLREGDWNDDASGALEPPADPPPPAG